MARKGKEYWQKHVDNWKNSKGKSVHKFCKENNLIQSTFMRWVDKLGSKVTPIKIDLPAIAGRVGEPIIIERSGLKITLPTNINPELLSVAIKEISQCF